MQNVIHNNLYSNRRTAATTVSNFQLASTASNKLCPKAAKFDTDFLSKCHQNPFNQASYRWHGRADNCYYIAIGKRSIAMSVFVCSACVCVRVCVFVCPRSYLLNYTSNLHQISVHVIPTAAARSSSGGVVICYVLPVLWLTSYLLISQPRLLDVAAPLKGSAHAALDLAINCAQ